MPAYPAYMLVMPACPAPEGKLLQALFGVQEITTKESCLKLPSGGTGRVIDVKWIELHTLVIPACLAPYMPCWLCCPG